MQRVKGFLETPKMSSYSCNFEIGVAGADRSGTNQFSGTPTANWVPN